MAQLMFSNNSGSTTTTQTCQADKSYIIYAREGWKPPLPSWATYPVLDRSEQILNDAFSCRVNKFIDHITSTLRASHQTQVERTDLHISFEALHQDLQTCFPSAKVQREQTPTEISEEWPPEFTECVAIFSLSSLAGSGKGIQPHGHKKKEPREKLEKLPESKFHARTARKYWDCVSSLPNCVDKANIETPKCKCEFRNISSREICAGSEKQPDCQHKHCDHCPDGGNYMSDVLG